MFIEQILCSPTGVNKALSKGPKGEDWPEDQQHFSFQLVAGENGFLFSSSPTLLSCKDNSTSFLMPVNSSGDCNLTLVVSLLCSVLLCLLLLLLLCMCVRACTRFVSVCIYACWLDRIPLLGSSLEKEDLEVRFYELLC